MVRRLLFFNAGLRAFDAQAMCHACAQRISSTYVWVSDQSNIAMFWVKKLISQSTVPAESPFFEEMILAHYTLMPIFFWTPLTPPICLKMTKCAIFSTFWESHFKNTPKVGVHRENFNIGNLSQIFFGDFYTCYEYAISFSAKFLIKIFSR